MNAPALACCVWELTLRCNLRCSHCGVHVPRDEAVLSGDKAYCSRDHARLGQDRPSG